MENRCFVSEIDVCTTTWSLNLSIGASRGRGEGGILVSSPSFFNPGRSQLPRGDLVRWILLMRNAYTGAGAGS